MQQDSHDSGLASAYEQLYRWFREQLPHLPRDFSSDARRSVEELVRRMPAPAEATRAEMRAIMHEVQTGDLEWAYGARNGARSNGELARAALEASGGYPSTDEWRELSSESGLWSALSAGRAARLLEEANEAFNAGNRLEAAKLLEIASRRATELDDPVTQARIAIAQVRWPDVFPQDAAQVIQAGLHFARAATTRVYTSLNEELSALLQGIQPWDSDSKGLEQRAASTGHRSDVFDLQQYSLVPVIREILEDAAGIVGDGPESQVATHSVLFQLYARGRSVLDPQWVGDFMHSELRTSNFPGLLKAQPQSSSPRTQPSESPRTMTPDLRRTLQLAAEIALRTTGSSLVHGRHLLGASSVDRANPAIN